MSAGTVARLPPLFPLLDGDPESVGGHVLLGRIGSGGMGVVFLSRTDRGALLAVKVVSTSYAQDPDFRARFAREVALAQRVRAACTPAVRAVGLGDARPWMAMEYVPGPTLSAHVRASGALSGARLLSFALGMAEALTAIHRAGVVHRDLKPGNVVLSHRGPSVLDFGIARALDVAPRTRGAYGTAGYVAPERLRGHQGPPVDVFAWGAVTAFAATGLPAFGTGEREERLYRAERGQAYLGDLVPPLLPLVRAALAPAFETRPTAGELFEALAGVLDEDTATTGESERERTHRILERTWPEEGAPSSPAQVRPGPDAPVPGAGPARRPVGPRDREDGVVFAGRAYTDPVRLVHTLAAHHHRAGPWLRGGGGRALRRWRPLRENVPVRAVLGEVCRGEADPQWALTALSVHLCPQQSPLYQGVAVDADGLAELARAGRRGADRPVLAEAFERGVVSLAAPTGDARTQLLADRVPGLAEKALELVRSVHGGTGRDHELRVWELAVLVVLGEDPPPEDGPHSRWRPGITRLWLRAATDPAARIALEVCAPGLRPPPASRRHGRRDANTGGGTDGSGRRRPHLPGRTWRQTLIASALMPVLPLLALSVGMAVRPFSVPYRQEEAAETGGRLAGEAAERAGDLYLPVLALSVVLALVRPGRLRLWMVALSCLVAVAALPFVPVPALWAPEAFRGALASLGQSWGLWVQWGGLLMGGACAALVTVLVRAATPGPLVRKPSPARTGAGIHQRRRRFDGMP
ncbi:serine/threonine-protein kinase [Nocardiopsis sp. CNT312]|uniref:serine/threonine-protein kinase n=1 Tax=Nocardiopsis sp. CNT312 TaxID=1137268 RepID=UPI0004AE7FC5|nr:serine/threonine-protein kinase [Nocardiopsis sp. CNT312]